MFIQFPYHVIVPFIRKWLALRYGFMNFNQLSKWERRSIMTSGIFITAVPFWKYFSYHYNDGHSGAFGQVLVLAILCWLLAAIGVVNLIWTLTNKVYTFPQKIIWSCIAGFPILFFLIFPTLEFFYLKYFGSPILSY